MGDCEPVASGEGEGEAVRPGLAGTGGDSDAAALDLKDQLSTTLSEELAMGACEATRAGPVIDVGSEDSGKDKYVISELAMGITGTRPRLRPVDMLSCSVIEHSPGGAEVAELTRAGPVTVLSVRPDTDETISISPKLASDVMATKKP